MGHNKQSRADPCPLPFSWAEISQNYRNIEDKAHIRNGLVQRPKAGRIDFSPRVCAQRQNNSEYQLGGANQVPI